MQWKSKATDSEFLCENGAVVVLGNFCPESSTAILNLEIGPVFLEAENALLQLAS